MGHGSGTSSSVQAPIEVGQQCRGTRRLVELQSDSRGTSQSSGSKQHKTRHRLSKDDQINSEAQMHCRRLVLAWFENHNMIHLEKRFLNDGERGLDEARRELQNLIFFGMVGDEWDEDRQKFGFEAWIDNQVNEAIFNATVAYYQVYGEGSTTGPGEKPDLLKKIENWKKGVVVAKGKRTRHVLPAFINRHLADTISTQGRHGVIWLPQNVEIIPMDYQTFQGSYGVVRRVIIRGASFIPDWIEFPGKTMKAKDSLENRKEHSVEALACPVDHPGVITIHYLNMRTYELYSLWWNGGSIWDMRNYDKFVAEMHPNKILFHFGLDFESRKRLVVYRKNCTYLAWALMCTVDIVHKHDVLHNDLNPNNVMLHFPRDRDDIVFIGVCDWGLSTWMNEEAPSNYGKESTEVVAKHKEKYYCAAPELFHVQGKRGTFQSPVRMACKHKHTIYSESFSVGALAKKIYHHDSTSNLFQKTPEPNSTKVRFELALNELTRVDPIERSTITRVVKLLKSPSYNLENPTMCFRDMAV